MLKMNLIAESITDKIWMTEILKKRKKKKERKKEKVRSWVWLPERENTFIQMNNTQLRTWWAKMIAMYVSWRQASIYDIMKEIMA